MSDIQKAKKRIAPWGKLKEILEESSSVALLNPACLSIVFQNLKACLRKNANPIFKILMSTPHNYPLIMGG